MSNKKTLDASIKDELGDVITDSGGRTDVLTIAQHLGFVVGNADIEDADGFIVVNDNEIIPEFSSHRAIGVNSTKGLKSKRYIIAMELSVYLEMRDRKAKEDGVPKEEVQLKFAKRHDFKKGGDDESITQIAQSLLMPLEEFVKKEKELSSTITDKNTVAQQLSDYFSVPFLNVRQRLDAVGELRQEGLV